MVGDIAGIIKFCAAREEEVLENGRRACGWACEHCEEIWRASSRTDCLAAMAAKWRDYTQKNE